MTCIVGVEWQSGQDGPRGVVVGGDSEASSGHFATLRADPKVWRRREQAEAGGHEQAQEIVAGYTTSFRMGQLLQYELGLPYRPADMGPDEWMIRRLVGSIRETLEEGGWLKKENEREEAGTLLVGYAGRLYIVDGDLQVGRSAYGYHVCGSGRRPAAGALHVLHRGGRASTRERAVQVAEAALEAAAEHTISVRGPWTIETLEETGDEP